ncbi:CsgG/HfaB family protein [Pyxidicoccus xibeiensis]|uniref:CsgG/HfaB family protein n=1 Tax=Pyxidicoccus xibeiensis TaxID=2906759 RepID=UPI0020A81458|nr:CsgG/HfaB family protein [Pyxidicoccus xibeiensis]MCP3137475.1 CsgG/HfaB family protein [Pyxidicoccus xibeiensis]
MSRLLPLLASLFVLLATAARAQTPPVEGSADAPAPVMAAPAAAPAAPAKESQKEALVVAVLALESNEAGRDSAPGVTSLIVSRLAESPSLRVLSQRDLEALLDAERQQQLLGGAPCDGGACLQELASVSGARYVVTGRLDRFGDQYLLTANLVDTFGGRSLARPRAEAPEADTLLRTAGAVADQLVASLVTPEDGFSPRPLLGGSTSTGGGGLTLGLRINNNFIQNLATLNPGVDLEVGYWFHPEWVGFAQLGFSYVRSNEEGAKGGLNVLPSVIGARHYHNVAKSLRPYWGLGLGVQLSFGDFGIFQSTGPLPTVVGFVGLEYLVAGHVGIQLEAGTNVAQAVLGLADSKLGDGLNLDLNAGIAYHF